STVSSLSRLWSSRIILSSAISRLSSRSRALRSDGSGAPGGGGVVGGSRRMASSRLSRSSSIRFSSLTVRGEASLSASQPWTVRISRSRTRSAVGSDAELGLLGQHRQLLGPVAQLGLLAREAGDQELGRARSLRDARGLGLGRLADLLLGLVHVGELD